MREIFLEQLATPQAQHALETLGDLVRSRKRVAILCFEADPAHCHRTIVATALAERMPLRIENLRPSIDD